MNNRVLFHDVLMTSQEDRNSRVAIECGIEKFGYGQLSQQAASLANGIKHLKIKPNARIAILLPNCPETVVSMFGSSLASCIFVPINPLQKPRQVNHILQNCGATALVTTSFLLESLFPALTDIDDLRYVFLTDDAEISLAMSSRQSLLRLPDLLSDTGIPAGTTQSPDDTAAILYTSGSTGLAKGVVLSHRNFVDGAEIVSQYLGLDRSDRILSALPLSFDYGLSQITTSFYTGCRAVLTNYLMPQKLLAEIDHYKITALAGVPTMWSQLATRKWPGDISSHLRVITNSGGKLPQAILRSLMQKLPESRIYLMYGLTEAFRSTYLDPSKVGLYPDSIGTAIPKVTIDVVRPDGTLCDAGEPGELVHSGALVTKGYWNDPEATKTRFRTLTNSVDASKIGSIAVWSGDIVKRDEDGLLYFVGRSDAMIKSSGYRISPTELEEVVFATNVVEEVAAVGIPDDILGHRIGLAVVPCTPSVDVEFVIRHKCAAELPSYMQPFEIRHVASLPKLPNGKIDRQAVSLLFKEE